jgi:hypothetical protein
MLAPQTFAFLNPELLIRSDDVVSQLVSLAGMYPSDFSSYDENLLPQQIRNFVMDLRPHPVLRLSQSLPALAAKMTELKKSIVYPLVYHLIVLALILPVSTASTERSFSALKYVKNDLRNRMGDEYLSIALILYVDNEYTNKLSVDKIIDKFSSMATRRMQFS